MASFQFDSRNLVDPALKAYGMIGDSLKNLGMTGQEIKRRKQEKDEAALQRTHESGMQGVDLEAKAEMEKLRQAGDTARLESSIDAAANNLKSQLTAEGIWRAADNAASMQELKKSLEAQGIWNANEITAAMQRLNAQISSNETISQKDRATQERVATAGNVSAESIAASNNAGANFRAKLGEAGANKRAASGNAIDQYSADTGRISVEGNLAIGKGSLDETVRSNMAGEAISSADAAARLRQAEAQAAFQNAQIAIMQAELGLKQGAAIDTTTLPWEMYGAAVSTLGTADANGVKFLTMPDTPEEWDAMTAKIMDEARRYAYRKLGAAKSKEEADVIIEEANKTVMLMIGERPGTPEGGKGQVVGSVTEVGNAPLLLGDAGNESARLISILNSVLPMIDDPADKNTAEKALAWMNATGPKDAMSLTVYGNIIRDLKEKYGIVSADATTGRSNTVGTGR